MKNPGLRKNLRNLNTNLAEVWATRHQKCSLTPRRSQLRLSFRRIIPAKNGHVSFWAIKYNVPRPAHCSLADPSDKIMINRENPAKRPSLAKNPPKYITAYIVQQSNCRWHCEPSCLLGWAFNKEKSLHTLSLQSHHLLSLHLNPSLSKPSVLSPWSVWSPKHKE